MDDKVRTLCGKKREVCSRSRLFSLDDSFLPGLLPREPLKNSSASHTHTTEVAEASKRKRKLIC